MINTHTFLYIGMGLKNCGLGMHRDAPILKYDVFALRAEQPDHPFLVCALLCRIDVSRMGILIATAAAVALR